MKMKNISIIQLFIFSILNLSVSGQHHYYQAGYGTPFDDEAFALCEADSFGHIVVGYTKGFNAGSDKDVYIINFDGDGKVKWTNHFDDGGNETGEGVLKHPSGEYFVMSNRENPRKILLSKISLNGNILWTKAISSSPLAFIKANEMILLPNGNLAFCGFQTKINGSITDSTGLILITDTSGNIIHYKDYNIGKGTSFNDMILTNDNQIAICGISSSPTFSILLVKSDINGDTVWTRKDSFNFQFLSVTSLIQYPSGKYLIGGGEPSYYGNSFLHCVTPNGDSVLFHKKNNMLCDFISDIKYSNWFPGICAADGYYNFKTHFGYLLSDTLGNMPSSITQSFYINSYNWSYADMVTESREIMLDDNSFLDPLVTIIGGQKFSGFGGMDMGIVHTKGDGNFHSFGTIQISAKTNSTLCPGDSVLITVDSNSYSTYHWINAIGPGTVDLGLYNDSIWVRESGYYYLVGMDSDSGIIISNEVKVDVIDTMHPVITSNGSTNFCYASGQTLTLNVLTTQGNQYQWYKNSSILTGSTGGNLNVVSSGIYTCKKINICGSFESPPVIVNAQSGTIPYFNLNSVGICRPWCNEIFPQEISIQHPVGIGNYYYQWYYNNTLIPNSNSTSTPLIGAGSYYCVVSNSCVSDSTIPYTVNALQKPSISGNNFICIAGDTTLLNLVNNGSLFVQGYQWYLNGNSILGAINQTLSATQPGNYALGIYASDCYNNPILSNPINVSISTVALPQVTLNCSDTSICFNQNVILTTSNSSYTKYWYLDGNLIGSSSSSSKYISIPGSYKVMIRNGCDSSYSNMITVHQYPYDQIGLGSDTSICNPDSILLDAGPGFNHYIWNIGDTTQSIFASNISSSIDTIQYIIQAIDSNNCSNSDSIQIIFDICSGLTELKNKNIVFYPNPFSTSAHILLEVIEKNSSIEIFNTIGELLLYKNITENPTFLNMSFFTSGLYLCVIRNSNFNYRLRIIKE
jgi:hypothetical protein